MCSIQSLCEFIFNFFERVAIDKIIIFHLVELIFLKHFLPDGKHSLLDFNHILSPHSAE